jgi:hypothetical protein
MVSENYIAIHTSRSITEVLFHRTSEIDRFKIGNASQNSITTVLQSKFLSSLRAGWRLSADQIVAMRVAPTWKGEAYGRGGSLLLCNRRPTVDS